MAPKKPSAKKDTKPPEEAAIEVTVDQDGTEVTYRLELDDMNGLERRAFREAVGVPVDTVGRAVVMGRLDQVEALAAVVWILRRREEAGLSLDDVLGSMDGSSFKVPEEGDPDPNPPG